MAEKEINKKSRVIDNSPVKNLYQVLGQHALMYPSPINLNYMWNFGSLSGLALVIQIISGLFLVMHYVPDIDLAFSSIEHIMRDVKYGWLIRYTHSNGSSFFFFVLYLHISRSLFYQSYTFPRAWVWGSGLLIFILTCATAFLGYILPWGQMSFWGATVITSMVTSIPAIGWEVTYWLWGGFSIDNPTLHRFFCLHYFLPFIISGLVGLHIYFLHLAGSNNPLGIVSHDNVPFWSAFVIKDMFGVVIYLWLFLFIICFYPNVLGHPDNYIKANCFKTPIHVVPEWYFLPYYAMLRCIPHKSYGILTMLGAIFGFFLLPVLNTSLLRGPDFKLLEFRFFVFFWFYNFIYLMVLGSLPIHIHFTWVTQLATVYYFIFWIAYIPFSSQVDNHYYYYYERH